MQKPRKKEILIIVVGVFIIVLSVLLNEWNLSYFTKDGSINDRTGLLLIRTANVIGVGLGAIIIIFRKREIIYNIILALIMVVITVIVFDISLYLLSPLLPQSLIEKLSPTIQLRYLEAHPDSTPWVYDGPVRYANPNKEITNLGLTVTADSLGYRNPQLLLEENPEIDVLLLGDSFVWGTEDRTIADYLRDFLNPLTVYSSAVSGSGIPQWRYHYQRFNDSKITSAPPDVVVLNFYSGNDLDDTQTFLAFEEIYYDSAKYYFTYNRHQYLLATANRPFGLPKLPEIMFITSSIIYQMQDSEQQKIQIGNEQVEVKLGEHEPHPSRFDEVILNALSKVTTTIRESSPETIIVLTYIPTGYGLYGGRTSDCPGCDYEIDFQMENSKILKSYAHELDIEYADFSSQLREQSRITPMWSLNDHLSAQGYELYSQLLAKKITFLMNRSTTRE